MSQSVSLCSLYKLSTSHPTFCYPPLLPSELSLISKPEPSQVSGCAVNRPLLPGFPSSSHSQPGGLRFQLSYRSEISHRLIFCFLTPFFFLSFSCIFFPFLVLFLAFKITPYLFSFVLGRSIDKCFQTRNLALDFECQRLYLFISTGSI